MVLGSIIGSDCHGHYYTSHNPIRDDTTTLSISTRTVGAV